MEDLVKALKLLEALRALRRPKGPPLREADIVAGSTMPFPKPPEPEYEEMEVTGIPVSRRGKAGRRPDAAISKLHPAQLPHRITEREITSDVVAPFPQHKPAQKPVAARRPVQEMRAVKIDKSEDELSQKRQQKQQADRATYLAGNWSQFNAHDWGKDAAAGLTHQDALEAMPSGKKVVWNAPMPANDGAFGRSHVLSREAMRQRATAPGSREWLAGLAKPRKP